MAERGDDRDAALVAAVAARDDAAFVTLYRRYLPVVLRWCLRETGNREVAADLSAEVFAAALISARRYRPEQGSVLAWLLGIARNKLLESQRRKRVEDSARRKLHLEPVALSSGDLDRVEDSQVSTSTSSRSPTACRRRCARRSRRGSCKSGSSLVRSSVVGRHQRRGAAMRSISGVQRRGRQCVGLPGAMTAECDRDRSGAAAQRDARAGHARTRDACVSRPSRQRQRERGAPAQGAPPGQRLSPRGRSLGEGDRPVVGGGSRNGDVLSGREPRGTRAVEQAHAVVGVVRDEHVAQQRHVVSRERAMRRQVDRRRAIAERCDVPLPAVVRRGRVDQLRVQARDGVRDVARVELGLEDGEAEVVVQAVAVEVGRQSLGHVRARPRHRRADLRGELAGSTWTG